MLTIRISPPPMKVFHARHSRPRVSSQLAVPVERKCDIEMNVPRTLEPEPETKSDKFIPVVGHALTVGNHRAGHHTSDADELVASTDQLKRYSDSPV